MPLTSLPILFCCYWLRFCSIDCLCVWMHEDEGVQTSSRRLCVALTEGTLSLPCPLCDDVQLVCLRRLRCNGQRSVKLLTAGTWLSIGRLFAWHWGCISRVLATYWRNIGAVLAEYWLLIGVTLELYWRVLAWHEAVLTEYWRDIVYLLDTLMSSWGNTVLILGLN